MCFMSLIWCPHHVCVGLYQKHYRWLWLIAITFVTFLVYGYDKAIAGSDRMRVPERVLLALTFAGGTIGAVVGRSFFRHKTLKTSFRIQLWLIVLLQIILVLVYILWIDPRSLRVE